MGILKPGDPEFEKTAKQDAKDLEKLLIKKAESPSNTEEVEFEMIKFPNFELHFTTVQQTEELTKIVFHFKRVSQKTMTKLAAYLHHDITEKMKPTAAIEAGKSPPGETSFEHRSQWDLILFHVPNVSVPTIRDGIIDIIKRFQG